MWYSTAMDIRHTTTIDAPPATVWALTIDVERWPELMPTVTRVTRLDEGPLRLGSTARIEQPGLRPAVWTVTEWEPGRRFAWSTRLFGAPVLAGHTIEPDGDGARNTLSLTLGGWRGRLLGLVLGRRMQEVLVTENACFRGVAEGQGATAASGGVEAVEPAAG
jgi:uncharacterized membrane protein